MGVYLSTGIGPVRVAHRVGGRRRRSSGGNPFLILLIAPIVAMLMVWWFVVPLSLLAGLTLTGFAVLSSPIKAGRARRFSWASHAFTLTPRYWKLIRKCAARVGV